MENMKPLTQDQLKEMTGKWAQIVLLDESETKGFAFIDKHELNTFFGYDSDKFCVKATFTFDECGKEFEAYSLEQNHIDREAWDCAICRLPQQRLYFSKEGFRHCPYCGAALTPGAKAKLKNRLRG